MPDTNLIHTPTAPPEFGHAMNKFWGFDSEYINLNHGSFGAPPLPVLTACRTLTVQIEENPDLFHRIAFQPLLRAVRERLARLIGAQTDNCVLVPNASHGVNTVLRNFNWAAGDVLVTNSTTYLSISHTVRYLSDQPPHPIVSEFELTFPTSHPSILDKFRKHLRSLKQCLPSPDLTTTTTTHGVPATSRPASPNKIVAVIDAICSIPGVHMPWRQMVQICKEEGVWSVIDAAHSIGQELDINIEKADPDFWVSNCHKWLYAKRPCAILYVPKRNHHIIKSTIPTSFAYTSPSSGKPQEPLWKQFEWNGTIDYAPALSVTSALDFRAYLGGEEKINAYCRTLAREGGMRLAELMGTEVMTSISKESGQDELTLNMVNVRLPLPPYLKPTPQINDLITTKLLVEHKISALHYYHGGYWWTRASAQVWNQIEDFEKLGRAFMKLCAEIMEKENFIVSCKL